MYRSCHMWGGSFYRLCFYWSNSQLSISHIFHFRIWNILDQWHLQLIKRIVWWRWVHSLGSTRCIPMIRYRSCCMWEESFYIYDFYRNRIQMSIWCIFHFRIWSNLGLPLRSQGLIYNWMKHLIHILDNIDCIFNLKCRNSDKSVELIYMLHFFQNRIRRNISHICHFRIYYSLDLMLLEYLSRIRYYCWARILDSILDIELDSHRNLHKCLGFSYRFYSRQNSIPLNIFCMSHRYLAHCSSQEVPIILRFLQVIVSVSIRLRLLKTHRSMKYMHRFNFYMFYSSGSRVGIFLLHPYRID